MTCPSETKLSQMLEGDTTSLEKTYLEEHLSRCPACRSLFVDLHLAASEDQALSSAGRAPRWLKRRVKALPRGEAKTIPRPPVLRWASAAALLLGAAGLGGLWLMGREEARVEPWESILREESLALFGPQLLEPSGGADISADRLSFRWSEVAGTHLYLLTILDSKGDVIYETATSQSSFGTAVEASELEGGGNIYFWYVTSRLPDGTELDSEIRKLTVR